MKFDWVNASPPSLAFKLTGPNNFTGFSGVTADTDLINLPADGTYILEVLAGTGPGGNYAFRLVETSVTDLILGTTHVGSLTGSGQTQLFRVNVPAGQQLHIFLDDNDIRNRHELYAQFGSPPKRSGVLCTGVATGNGSQAASNTFLTSKHCLYDGAAPGTWYILLYSEAVLFTGSFALTATAGDIFLSGVSPGQGSDGMDLVLTVTGAGFDHTTSVELVDASAAAFSPDPTRTSVDLPTQLTATFAAGSVPVGTYSVRVQRPGGGSAVLPNAFQVLPGAQPRLELQLIPPRDVAVGRGFPSTLYVEYANTGNAPMTAPLLILHGSNRALLTLDNQRLVQAFRTPAVPDGFSDTVQFIGSGVTPGTLQPGERIRVPVYFVGLMPPIDNSIRTVFFSLSSLRSTSAVPIDWPSFDNGLRPPGISIEAWTPIFANVTAQIGSTWGDYVRTLAENAAYLGRLGRRVIDVSELWGFEIQQAIGLGPLSSLTTVTDIHVDAPGMPITFQRVFSSNIVGATSRARSAAAGPGLTAGSCALTIESDGTVVVSGLDGRRYRFEPDRRGTGNQLFSEAGDRSSLTALGGGEFLLREPAGMQTRFRGDGRVDYVEDPNGNRIVATWTGSELTRLTHTSGQFLQITYNGVRIVSLTDQANRAVTFIYDAAGEHLVSVLGIDGQTTHYTYSAGAAPREHALLSIEYPDLTHEFWTYDVRGRIDSSARDDNAERITYAYGSAGEVTTTNALDGVIKYAFDHRSLLAAVENALGDRTVFDYDRDFNLVRIIDPLGQNYNYEYDRRGNLIRATNALGQVTVFSYTTDFNHLASMIDAPRQPVEIRL